jgi:dihydrofolate reductase
MRAEKMGKNQELIMMRKVNDNNKKKIKELEDRINILIQHNEYLQKLMNTYKERINDMDKNMQKSIEEGMKNYTIDKYSNVLAVLKMASVFHTDD